MIQLFPQYIEQIRLEAREDFPDEAVWLITKKGCIKVANVHPEPEEHFDVSAEDTRKAHAQGLLAVVHSHCNGKEYPSKTDMTYQINSNVPWGIVTTNGETSSRVLWWGGATAEEIEPLEGRTFRHGVTDCYAAIRDWFFLEKQIELPDFAREWRWWETSDNHFVTDLEAAGFSVVDDPQPGDVWLASLGARDQKLNHCGVLLENGLTYHHPGSMNPVDSSRKAVKEPIYIYLQRVAVWVRHKDI